MSTGTVRPQSLQRPPVIKISVPLTTATPTLKTEKTPLPIMPSLTTGENNFIFHYLILFSFVVCCFYGNGNYMQFLLKICLCHIFSFMLFFALSFFFLLILFCFNHTLINTHIQNVHRIQQLFQP